MPWLIDSWSTLPKNMIDVNVYVSSKEIRQVLYGEASSKATNNK